MWCWLLWAPLPLTSTGFHWSSYLPFTLRLPFRGPSGCIRCWFPQCVTNPISFVPGIHSSSVLAQSFLLLIFSGQYIFRIFHRHRLVKVCFFHLDLVTLQVSEPRRRTDFTLVVKIRTCSLVFMDIDVEFHTALRVLKSIFAYPAFYIFARSSVWCDDTL